MALDAQGWTILATSGDSRVVYVSSSGGSDSNDGLSTGAPKATIAAGLALLRDGYPDWLLLKCGDTWTDETIGWTLSGRSASEPMVITSYGTGARPLLRRSGDAGVFSHTGTRHAYLSIVDLHLYGRYGTPTASSGNAISVVAPIDDLLIEGCKIENFSGGLATGGPDGTQYRTTVRRNVFCDIYATDGVHSNANYYGTTEDLLIEENVYDMVGWMDGNPNATGKTVFRHGVYIQTTCANVVFRKNYVINAAANAVQVRPGGEVSDCVFSHNSIGPLVAADQPANSTGQLLTRNYIEYGQDIGSGGLQRGWGCECQEFDGGVASYNLVAHNTDGSLPVSFNVQYAPGDGITLDHNVVYEWSPAGENNLILDGSAAEMASITLTNNQFQQPTASPNYLIKHSPSGTTNYTNVTSSDNQFWSDPGTGFDFHDGTTDRQFASYMSLIGDTTSTNGAVTYTDPTRDLAAYHGYIGGTATLAAFTAALRNQRKGAWNTALETIPVANWIRAGFDLVVPSGSYEKFAPSLRDAWLNAIETAIDVAPTLEIRTGSVPTDCAAPDNGTLLVSITLPSDWMAAASGGSKAMAGVWGAAAAATGTAGHFRIKASGVCHVQGAVTATGGGGDMTMQNTSVATGQQVAVGAFTIATTT